LTSEISPSAQWSQRKCMCTVTQGLRMANDWQVSMPRQVCLPPWCVAEHVCLATLRLPISPAPIRTTHLRTEGRSKAAEATRVPRRHHTTHTHRQDEKSTSTPLMSSPLPHAWRCRSLCIARRNMCAWPPSGGLSRRHLYAQHTYSLKKVEDGRRGHACAKTTPHHTTRIDRTRRAHQTLMSSSFSHAWRMADN
jgi:hypothetical protein